MNMRILGDTGIKVSELGLGTWPLGGSGPAGNYGPIGEVQAMSVLEAYASAGGNFIDTARVYNRAENIVGKYLARACNRDNFVIATKTTAGDSKESISRIRQDLETSLRVIGTDFIDVFLLHQPPAEAELIDEVMDEMQALKDEGKVRAIGASIKGANVTAETERLCDIYLDTKRVDVIEVVYSLIRQRNAAVIDRAKQSGVGVIIRTVLESGLLTGEYSPGHVFKGNDHRARYTRQRLDFVLGKATELASYVPQAYRSLSDLAVRFSLGHAGVSCVIFGAKNENEISLNTSALALPTLSLGLIEELREKYGSITEQANMN